MRSMAYGETSISTTDEISSSDDNSEAICNPAWLKIIDVRPTRIIQNIV